jgi:hypothetical protein
MVSPGGQDRGLQDISGLNCRRATAEGGDRTGVPPAEKDCAQ